MNTGYAECAREICNRLGEKYWVTHVSAQAQTGGYKPEGYNFDVIALSDNGTDLLQSYLDKYKPDALIIQEDPFTMFKMGMHQYDYGNTKFIPYCAIDSMNLDNGCHELLNLADQIVCMNEWGQEQMEREGFEDVEVIYHGTKPSIYFPRSDDEKKEIRQKVSNLVGASIGKEVNFTDKCVYYLTGRNTARKNHFDAIRAFLNFAKDKEDVVLLCNAVNYDAFDMDAKDWVCRVIPGMGEGEKDALNNKVFFLPSQSFNRGFPDVMMGEFMGGSDFYYTLALGEGFGMNIAHAISSNVPVISSEFTTPKYLVGDKRGFLIKSTDVLKMGGFGRAHYYPDVKDAQEKLEASYKMWKSGTTWSCFNKEDFESWTKDNDWDRIAEQWDEVLQDVTGYQP